MVNLASDRNLKPWSNAIASPANEFPLTPLEIIAGNVPSGLRGSLYRNGPGRLQRGDLRVGHWFDGDGAILAVHFSDSGPMAVYRYVLTSGYQAETAANSFIFPNYGMTAPGPFWNNWGKDVKNSANTSVLALSDRLLALWEGGRPHALDLDTLDTIGLDNLTKLEDNDSFSAHPKVDPETGEIFNFGVAAGINATLNLYRSNCTGKIVKKSSFNLEGLPLIHDFVMAGPYLIFFVPPVRVNLFPAAVGIASFSEAMEWKPDLGMQILIFDRNNLSLVSRTVTDPFYQWHFTNAYLNESGSEIAIELVRYPDFQTNQNLKEVSTGKINTPAKGTLWQINIDPHTAKVIKQEELLDRKCDFPIVSQQQVSQPWRYTYLSTYQDGSDITANIFNAIARFDRKTGNLSIANLEDNCYPSEPIYVRDRIDFERGWLLTVVYNGNTDTSQVWIYDSENIEGDPVCKLALPEVVPHGFHGTWKQG
ncbi:MAG: carotenoid oxygenase family protein [Prochloraceae cyanobacterium]